MTTESETRTAIYRRFLTNFDELTSDRIAFDNENFIKPDSGNWVRLTVRHSVRSQYTIGEAGNRKVRGRGRIFIQVFTSTGAGQMDGDNLCRLSGLIFDTKTFEGVICEAYSVRESGPDGEWNQGLVEIPFTYFDVI